MKLRLKKFQAGFTLLEIVIVMSIFLFIVVSSYDFIIQTFKAGAFSTEQDDASRTARKAADVMVREIREAAYSSRGDYIFDTLGTSTLIFYSNVDNDTNEEKIRYFVSGTFLNRGVTKATGSPLQYLSANEKVSPIVYYVNNQSLPVFTYYDTNNNLIANPSANKIFVRLVHISLMINVTPSTAPKDYYLDSDIQIRNLKDNL
jgi:prepilin-type N-terminal cleavage/methylation domain-containing protein